MPYAPGEDLLLDQPCETMLVPCQVGCRRSLRRRTFHLEESWQELEFVILRRDWIGQLLAVVERLEQRLEPIVYHHSGVSCISSRQHALNVVVVCRRC